MIFVICVIPELGNLEQILEMEETAGNMKLGCYVDKQESTLVMNED